MGAIVKSTLFAAVAVAALAGCGTAPTMEEAEAACARRGGLLTVIYSQEITAAGIGQRVAHPGACVSPKNFEAGSPPAK